METEHNEEVYEKVADDRPFWDRLVPSVKMEAARRKHLDLTTKRAVPAGGSDLRQGAQEATISTRASAFLITKDGMRGPVLQMGTLGFGSDWDHIKA